jgi:hypothetical protein
MRLTAAPNIADTFEEATDCHVTIVAADAQGAFLFVGFEPKTLQVRWTQRAPGSLADIRGWNDHRGRDGLWRSFLCPEYRTLLDRFEPGRLVTLAGMEAEAEPASGQPAVLSAA